jgi:glutathione S-transferase
MIVLYSFGPAFGLPDPSPFVMKTEVQLKMAGLAYRRESGRPQNGPKGKIPYIVDDSRTIGDSTFIRDHIAQRHGIDLERGLGAEQKALGWAAERMLEDHLYWAMVHFRWLDDENFAKGPAHFFDGFPEEIRETTRAQAREGIRQTLYGQGLGRHTPREIADLGGRSLDALSTLLGDKSFMMGSEPTAVDATAFGVFAGIATPFFDAPLARRAREHDNLMAYRDRVMKRYYPDFAGG